MISAGPQEASQGSSLLQRVQQYTSPSNWRSIAQILTSFVPFVVTWYLMLRSLQVSYWLTLLLAVFEAGFLVRIFIIQHDCGHGSFFRSRRANDLVGSLLGVLTLTPYKSWRRQHAIHHATSGNLDQRGVGDIQTLTVEEYRALSPWRKLLYRIYRHPALLFGAGAMTQFVVLYRTTLNVPRTWRSERLGVHWTNLGLVSLIAVLGELVGWRQFMLVQLPITAISCSAGVWLFYVQHQFENTYWERESKWDYSIAAIQGSSHYALPKVLQWF
ncbi:MAG TPA: fatty acid desaturase, partial [Thermoanaerobaculia bacterium]|nr:fatty acid desaturase [Thermoanaerobaculia bacterium]